MRQRIDVDREELDQIIDRSTHAPLSESEGRKLKTALHAFAEGLARKRSTEKPTPFYRRMLRPWTSRIPASRLARDMDAMAPRRLPALIAHAAEIGKLHRAGVNKSEIARRVQVGRTSVRRILAALLPRRA